MNSPHPPHPPSAHLVAVPISPDPLEPPPSPPHPITLWRRLLWAEWYAHSRLILGFLIFWLLVVWVIPLIAHPLWILTVGPLFAMVAGPAFAGVDILEGCEEGSFSLPSPRHERFLARLAVGGGTLVLLSLMTILALEGNLSDVLLRVFLSSGLPDIQPTQPMLLYGLVIAAPFAIFAFSFAAAALATSRTLVLTSWVWGILSTLTVLRGGVLLEEFRWQRFNGMISVPLLLVASSAILWLAARFYSRKEATTSGTPFHIPPSLWGWLIAIVAAGIGVALLAAWFTRHFFGLL